MTLCSSAKLQGSRIVHSTSSGKPPSNPYTSRKASRPASSSVPDCSGSTQARIPKRRA